MSFLCLSDNVKRLRAFLDVAKVPTVLVYPTASSRGQTLELWAYGSITVRVVISHHDFNIRDSLGEFVSVASSAENAAELVKQALSI